VNTATVNTATEHTTLTTLAAEPAGSSSLSSAKNKDQSSAALAALAAAEQMVGAVTRDLDTAGQGLTQAAGDTSKTLSKAALTVSEALRNTELTLTTATAQAAKTLTGDVASIVTAAAATSAISTTANSAAATSAAAEGTVSWLNGDIAVPGSYVNQALKAIWNAQAVLAQQTWGTGNVFAGVVSLVPEAYLAVAQWALSSWQGTNPVAMNLVASTASIPIVGDLARVVLLSTELMPTLAVATLQGEQQLSGLVALFGGSAAVNAAGGLVSDAATNGRVYAAVPLSMYAGVEPIVEISINGGPMVKVLVDTGSSGLVIANEYVGQTGLGASVGSGSGAYSGGLTYNYNVYNTTVSFGNGITTGTTQVNIVTDASTAAFESFLAGNGVVGVLGIGANAVGPGPSLVTAALPGELGDGVYIDEQHGLLVFGPNPLPARVTLPGSPYAQVTMTAGNGSTYTGNLIIDSGGVFGTVSSSSIPVGTTITVTTPDGTTLYSYTTEACTQAGTVCSTSTAPNSGYYPFKQYAIYIGYSTPLGTTSFDL
jgi:hypothetical protein